MKPQKPFVEISHKLTEAQKAENRILELEEKLDSIAEENLKLRQMMIDIRKEQAEINKKLTQINKSKNNA